MSALFRTRLAPTPSGFLHAGNIFSFVLTWLICREQAGRMLLRIDDLDGPRTRQDVIEDLFRTLEWVGLTWDEGPTGPDDFRANWSQTLRIERYQEAAQDLRRRGYLFPCACSRKQVAERSADGQYPGTCRNRPPGGVEKDCAWRLHTPSPSIVTLHDRWKGELSLDVYQCLRDPILIRKDGVPAYQLASVVDDVDFQITHIVRGEDLLSSSAAQVHLARTAGMQNYLSIITLHHPLLLDANQSKLSKSKESISINAMRSQGVSARALLQWIAERLHIDVGEECSLESLLTAFRAQGGLNMRTTGCDSLEAATGWQWTLAAG